MEIHKIKIILIYRKIKRICWLYTKQVCVREYTTFACNTRGKTRLSCRSEACGSVSDISLSCATIKMRTLQSIRIISKKLLK